MDNKTGWMGYVSVWVTYGDKFKVNTVVFIDNEFTMLHTLSDIMVFLKEIDIPLFHRRLDSIQEVDVNEKQFPRHVRGLVGARMLWAIYGGAPHAYTKAITSAAGRSLDCRWGIVVDMDKGVVELYRGANGTGDPGVVKLPHIDGRFHKHTKCYYGDVEPRIFYHPIRLVGSIPFDTPSWRTAFSAANKTIESMLANLASLPCEKMPAISQEYTEWAVTVDKWLDDVMPSGTKVLDADSVRVRLAGGETSLVLVSSGVPAENREFVISTLTSNGWYMDCTDKSVLRIDIPAHLSAMPKMTVSS